MNKVMSLFILGIINTWNMRNYHYQLVLSETVAFVFLDSGKPERSLHKATHSHTINHVLTTVQSHYVHYIEYNVSTMHQFGFPN